MKHLLKYRSNEDYRDEVDNLIKKHLVLKCNEDGKSSYVSPFRESVYFPKTEDGMSIEYYFKNIQKCAYVDLDFYQIEDIGEDKLSLLGVSREIADGQDRTNGEYYTGNPGRQPEWTTYGAFRWKLTLKRLDMVLEYISSHPKAADSMANLALYSGFCNRTKVI